MKHRFYKTLDRLDAWRQRNRSSRWLRILPRHARIWLMQPAWSLYQCGWCGNLKDACPCRTQFWWSER